MSGPSERARGCGGSGAHFLDDAGAEAGWAGDRPLSLQSQDSPLSSLGQTVGSWSHPCAHSVRTPRKRVNVIAPGQTQPGRPRRRHRTQEAATAPARSAAPAHSLMPAVSSQAGRTALADGAPWTTVDGGEGDRGRELCVVLAGGSRGERLCIDTKPLPLRGRVRRGRWKSV